MPHQEMPAPKETRGREIRADASGRLPITVIIPVYNRASLLERCLASVWAQRPYLPAEVIVIDDGSADDTADVAANLGARVVVHAENQGLAAARNTGLGAATYDWAALLDSDDEWLPHHLSHLWQLREHHVLVGSSIVELSTDPPSTRFRGWIGQRPLVVSDPARILAPQNLFSASASMVHRGVALSVGGFKPHFGVVEDLDLWVRILERHTAVCSPTITVRYHAHGEQMSLDMEKMHNGHRAVANGHIDRPKRGATALERWEGVAAWDKLRVSLANGERREALRTALSIVVRPQRVAGLPSMMRVRLSARRKAARVGNDGEPSVAVLVRDDRTRSETLERLRGRTVRDLTNCSVLWALCRLLRTPAGIAVVDSAMLARALRLAGIRSTTTANIPDVAEG